MPRPRTNDPLGVSDHPRVVTDVAVTERVTQEFQLRFVYTLQSFTVARAIEKDRGTVEASLIRVREALARKRPWRLRGARLHPLIEAALSRKARECAAERTGVESADVKQRDIQKAAHWLTDAVPIKQGAPADHTLRHHVEALMALAQETTGRPVLARRDRDNVYDPHLADPKAQMIFEALHAIDADVTVTSVVNIIREARRRYAGKAMRFHEFMPAYAGTVEEFAPNFPIYCP